MIKGDTSTAKGTRIFQDADDNAFLDLRSGTSNSISFRLEDHALGNKSTMLQLRPDDKSLTDRYGAEIGGRVKTSQLYVSEGGYKSPGRRRYLPRPGRRFRGLPEEQQGRRRRWVQVRDLCGGRRGEDDEHAPEPGRDGHDPDVCGIGQRGRLGVHGDCGL
jgi:hypothetical protein